MRFSHCFLVLLVVLPLLMSPHAEAQEAQKFRIIIADTLNLSSDNKPTCDITTAVNDALYCEFTNPVRSKNPPVFQVMSTLDISAAAKRLGRTTRTQEDYLRIAEELKADLLLNSESVSYVSFQGRKRNPNAGVQLTILDVALRIPVGLGVAVSDAKTLPKAVERAVKEAMRQSWDRFGITANILKVLDDVVVLDRGANGGLRVGDKFIVYHEINGQRIKKGLIGISRSFPSDAEADILEGKDFLPEDKLVRFAKQPFDMSRGQAVATNDKQ